MTDLNKVAYYLSIAQSQIHIIYAINTKIILIEVVMGLMFRLYKINKKRFTRNPGKPQLWLTVMVMQVIFNMTSV